jgi:hypothetical protein
MPKNPSNHTPLVLRRPDVAALIGLSDATIVRLVARGVPFRHVVRRPRLRDDRGARFEQAPRDRVADPDATTDPRDDCGPTD